MHVPHLPSLTFYGVGLLYAAAVLEGFYSAGLGEIMLLTCFNDVYNNTNLLLWLLFFSEIIFQKKSFFLLCFFNIITLVFFTTGYALKLKTSGAAEVCYRSSFLSSPTKMSTFGTYFSFTYKVNKNLSPICQSFERTEIKKKKKNHLTTMIVSF